MQTDRQYFIVGGAGFLGSHFADRLLGDAQTERVTVYDNFSSGRDWHVEPHLGDPRFSLIRGDVVDLELLTSSVRGHDTVIHLASNPDIAAAASDPDIDFRQGTVLTRNVVEAMRIAKVPKILYASGSGVYGDLGEIEAHEDHGPLTPVSTYGASKLAGEALISSYCAMFGMRGYAFRFGNVVGPRQTHGVGFDFLRRLLEDPNTLRILGDGRQSKSYIHCEDVMNAVLQVSAQCERPFQCFNVATGDYITVTEIAGLACAVAGLAEGQTVFAYTGGARGWSGDVPVVRLNTNRIRSTGWRCQRTSAEAIRSAMEAMLRDSAQLWRS